MLLFFFPPPIIECVVLGIASVSLTCSSREMAVGNTFGATALSSYGGFWISYAIIFIPGGFEIIDSIVKVDHVTGLNYVVGLWLLVSFVLPIWFPTILPNYQNKTS